MGTCRVPCARDFYKNPLVEKVACPKTWFKWRRNFANGDFFAFSILLRWPRTARTTYIGGVLRSGGRGLPQLVTADTPWCNRSAFASGLGVRRFGAPAAWCNRSAACIGTLSRCSVSGLDFWRSSIRRVVLVRFLLTPLGDKLGDLWRLGQSSCSDGTAES